MIFTFECAFCNDYVKKLKQVCPIRPEGLLEKYSVSETVVP